MNKTFMCGMSMTRAKRFRVALLLVLLGGGSWLWALPGAARAQVETPHRAAMAEEVPLLVDSPAGIRSLAHGADGTLVVGGQKQERFGGCGPRSRAFLARRDASGQELWHSGSGLLADVTSLDPRYVLASTVHDVTVDPFTDEIFAVVETLSGWRGESCVGVAAARGTLVLRLAADGTLLHDNYLGARPDGPPPTRLGCSELCAPERYEQVLGRNLEVASDGDVVVTGRRWPAAFDTSAQLRGDAVFTTRLRPDLSLEPALGFAKTQQATLPGTQCALGTGDVLSVQPVRGIITSDDYPQFLGSRDDCKIKISPDGMVATYGIQVELQLPTPLPDPFKIELELEYMAGVSTRKQLSVKRVMVPDANQYDPIKSWPTDPNGKLVKTANVTALIANIGGDIVDYIHSGNRLIYRLETVTIHAMDTNCEESFEYDRGC